MVRLHYSASDPIIELLPLASEPIIELLLFAFCATYMPWYWSKSLTID